MADTQTKNTYVNYEGLAKAFELIAGKYETIANVSAFKTEFNALVALVGAAAKGDAEAKTILERIAALEGLAGTDSVADQITAAVEALDATVGSTTIAEGKHVAVQVVEANGVLTGVTVTEDDIASAAGLEALETLVGKATDAKDAATVFGAIAKEADRADTAEKANAQAIANEEAARKAQIGELGKVTVGEGEGAVEKDQTVVGYITAEIAKVNGDADALADDLADEVEARETAVKSEKERAEAAEKALADRLDVVEGEATVEGSIKKAVADEATRINGIVGTVPASVGETATGTVVAYVDAKVAQTNADNVALAARVKANEDALAIVNGEATVDGSIKKAAADAVAKVVASAPEDFDTLQEVAAWIASDTTNSAALVARVTKLEGDENTDGSVAKAVKVEETRALAAEAGLKAAIDAFVPLTDAEIVAAFEGNVTP